jgi:Protein of unknown function (DUF2934)
MGLGFNSAENCLGTGQFHPAIIIHQHFMAFLGNQSGLKANYRRVMKTKANTPPSHDAISGRARTLWEAAGRPDGEDLNHWLQAEKELNNEAADTDGEFIGTSDTPAPTRKSGNSRPPISSKGRRP